MPLRGGVCGRVGNDGISVSHLETPVQKEACLDQLAQHTHTHTHTHGPSIHRDTYSPLTHELTNACCKGILTLSTRPSPYSVNTFRQATAQIRTGRHVCILALGVPGHLVEPPLPMHTLAALPLTPMHRWRRVRFSSQAS